MTRRLLIPFLLLLTTTALAQPPVQPNLAGLDDYILTNLKAFKVPGVAIAIVKDNQIILSKGYGYRDVEKQLPVTSQTLFGIGSVTKSFSVTMLGTLADEGKLNWDQPVREYFPAFRLQDPVATEQMTMRDLTTHRSGLARHDPAWYTQQITRKELISRLRYLEPNKPFRSIYQYSNLMYITAGELGAQLAGTTWEQAVQTRVLNPLGLHNTNFSVLTSQQTSDFAIPYTKDHITSEVYRIPFYNSDLLGGAGEINSCADDLARYMLFHLNLGSIDGKQILSRAQSLQMQTPQMAIPGKPEFKELGTASYGLAFNVSTYRGHPLSEHGGSIDGYLTQFKFLPDDKLGVIVLANLDETPLSNVLARNILDRLLGLNQIDWAKRALNSMSADHTAEAAAKTAGYSERKLNTHPSHDLKDYTGNFTHPAYGLVTISLSSTPDHPLDMKLNQFAMPLDHYHYDTFQVPENVRLNFSIQGTKISFTTNPRGDIATLSIPLEPAVAPITFTRQPDKRLLDPTFLATLTGIYANISITLDGNKLYLARPTGPKLTLVPDRDTAFTIADRPGQAAEFKPDGLLLLQPNGTAEFYKRK